MKTTFIINKNGHYFTVEVTDFNAEKINGHTLHQSLSDMYQCVCEQQGLAMDEVESSEIKFKQIGDVVWEIHSTGGGAPVDLEPSQSLEIYISKYQL